MMNEEYWNNLIVSGEAIEALSWITEENVPERSLGECTRRESSIELVQYIYNLGAVNVWVFEIDGAPDEMQNSGRLIIELPEQKDVRKKILEESVELGNVRCFDPEPDEGQRYTIVMLD